MADMPVVDAAVRDVVKAEVLQPRIVIRVLDRVVEIVQREEHGHPARVSR